MLTKLKRAFETLDADIRADINVSYARHLRACKATRCAPDPLWLSAAITDGKLTQKRRDAVTRELSAHDDLTAEWKERCRWTPGSGGNWDRSNRTKGLMRRRAA